LPVIDHLAELHCDARLLRFCEYVFRGVPWGRIPDYRSIDFIAIPDLAPQCFAVDVRGGLENGLLIKYSGTQIDEHFERNVQGLYLENVYRDKARFESVRDMYRRCISERVVCFRRRPSSIDFRIVGKVDGVQDLLLVPCVSDGGNRVEFVVGIGVFIEGTNMDRSGRERLAYLGLGC